MIGIFIKFKDNTFNWGCITLPLELFPLKIIIKLESSLISTYLFSKGENISEVKIIYRNCSLNWSETNLINSFNLRFLLSDFSFGITTKTYYLYFVFFKYLVKFLHFGANIKYIFLTIFQFLILKIYIRIK